MLEDLGRDLVLMARLVQSQLGGAMNAFLARDAGLAARVTEKDDQVDNLLDLIEAKCFQRIAGEAADSPQSRRWRGVLRVALNLEKLGDYAVDIAEQAGHLTRGPVRPLPFDLAVPSQAVLTALDEVVRAFTEADAEKAKHACRCEAALDRQYRDALGAIVRWLSQPDADAALAITVLSVAKALEQIGDAILNIGEATLFILTGERLKLHQYLHLEQVVQAVSGDVRPPTGADFHRIWGGISGARVGHLSVGAGGRLVWKEGHKRKIAAEIRQTSEWNRLVPGLVPPVEARHEEADRQSFVRAYLDGLLLRDVYLTRPWPEKVRATRRLLETLRDVWAATLRRERPVVDYVRQIRDRLPEVYALHPELARLRAEQVTVFGIGHRSLAELLEELAGVEVELAPPVTVRIHGDFNTDNIVWDPATERIHFIDVHRSGDGDYLQDIAVLLVSGERTPLDEPEVVRALGRLQRSIHEFAAEFASRVGDAHFEARLNLARARALITSARLIPDAEFARSLYLRGVRLLERAAGAAV